MAKMKLKTHSGAKKRFKLTKNGKIKRFLAPECVFSFILAILVSS